MGKIIMYFTKEKHTTEIVAKILAKTLTKYTDIESEFIYWIDNRNFDAPNALVIDGYSAKIIHAIAPFLDVAGIYNFMVTLRDDPQKAQEYIKKGFPRK